MSEPLACSEKRIDDYTNYKDIPEIVEQLEEMDQIRKQYTRASSLVFSLLKDYELKIFELGKSLAKTCWKPLQKLKQCNNFNELKNKVSELKLLPLDFEFLDRRTNANYRKWKLEYNHYTYLIDFPEQLYCIIDSRSSGTLSLRENPIKRNHITLLSRPFKMLHRENDSSQNVKLEIWCFSFEDVISTIRLLEIYLSNPMMKYKRPNEILYDLGDDILSENVIIQAFRAS